MKMAMNRNLSVFLSFTFVVTLLICLKETQINNGRHTHHVITETTQQSTRSSEGTTPPVRETNALWEAEQKERRRALRDACRGQDQEYLLEYLLNNPKRLGHLLVDDKHRAIYCYVPKVACTIWKQIWAVMTGYLRMSPEGKLPHVLPHYLTQKMSLLGQHLSKDELRFKLSNYTKFVTARHPTERLLSAFRNKFESDTRDARNFKRLYGSRIIRTYRKGMEDFEDVKKSKDPRKTGEGLQFSEFVTFLLDKKDLKDVNEHWRPYEYLCHPCALSYDVIGKYESLGEDSERFLRLVGAPSNLHFPPYTPTNTSGVLVPYLASLSPEQLSGLRRVLQRDFQLFQYDIVKVPRTSD